MVAADHIDIIDAKVQGVPAENAFTHALLDSMQSQLEGIQRMKSALLQAAQLVE